MTSVVIKRGDMDTEHTQRTDDMKRYREKEAIYKVRREA